MTAFQLRCGRCRTTRQYTGTLEQARTQICGPCSAHSHYSYRMTVVGREEVAPAAVDLAHAPAIERPYLSASARAYINTKSRVLILSAFEETP